ncbi:hypothetical protein BDN70DRAFT_289522 [Pholiota conissans]|uniref:Fe2OG dioxygenase domain-containing protein n=1 Tax=Pholiota conissans TaxID=109636 RepID=A0A9P5ZAD6_9AGAR|nr:hypothetical protein BDN70DRAFT_289522 [Pholiota conissans]
MAESEQPSEQEYPTLKAVQAAFKKVVNVPPYCTGTVALELPQSLLFYRSQDEARFIDFANPTEDQLKALADACSPASFGRNQENVLDENYRKAGKMDAADLCTQFSPWNSGVLKTVVDSLFRSNNKSIADVEVELYKLNVYGPGSFFKPHVDTPRSDTMFGSLVVVLPTPHAGGSLSFRHLGIEYVFDSAASVADSSSDTPHAAFAAFFSDVEHEVAEVTSGYRVTLTYNLYHATRNVDVDSVRVTQPQNVDAVKSVLASFVSNPKFLCEGGLLVFGLCYDYPFNRNSTNLSNFSQRLKGIDAVIMDVCNALGLEASIMALYHGNDEDIHFFVNCFVFLPDYQTDDDLGYYLRYNYDVIVGHDEGSEPYESYDDEEEGVDVVWATPMDNRNTFKDPYISYGNEASLEYAYGKICLVVPIKSAEERV